MMGIPEKASYIIAILKSSIRVFFLRMRGARVGKRVLLGSVYWQINPVNIFIGDGVVIKDGVSFENLESVQIKDYVKIHKDVHIQASKDNSGKLIVGYNSWIGERTIINCSRDITIGNDVGIGAYSQLWTHGYFPSIADGYPYKYGNITIKNGAWLPPSCLVLPGVEIGEYAIIGTGSVVTKNIGSKVFAMGIPCKVVIDNEKQYRKTLKASEKIDMVLKHCIKYMKLHGFNIEEQGDKTWFCSLYHKKFLLAYREDPMEWKPDRPACIFTWKLPKKESHLSDKITIFILSNNTYTKKGSFYEWVIIRALLDTCVLRITPI
jgi:acetyltransferase-like isoleucine patch superfamily enzyme